MRRYVDTSVPITVICSWSTLKRYLGLPWEIEYQVLEGGELDIDFMVISPKGQILVDEKRSEEGLHEISALDKGDFQVHTGLNIIYQIRSINYRGTFGLEFMSR